MLDELTIEANEEYFVIVLSFWFLCYEFSTMTQYSTGNALCTTSFSWSSLIIQLFLYFVMVDLFITRPIVIRCQST